MGSGVADWGATQFLSSLFGVTAPISGFYVALASTEPGPGMDGSVIASIEPTDTAYSRKLYSAGSSHWAVSANYAINTSEVDFGLPTADWGLVTHFALMDSPTGGNLYAWGDFMNPQYVQHGYHMLVPPGGLMIALRSIENTIAV